MSTEAPLPSCREIVDRLGDWVEGGMGAGEAEGYRRHLELCPPCGDLARSYRSLGALAREALEVRMPEGARQRLWQLLGSRFHGLG